MILVSSAAGLKGQPFLTPYVASKHGLVGIMRSLANELASEHIRVNSLHPTGVDTPMLNGMVGLTERIEASPDVGSLFLNSLPVDLVRAEDVSHAVLFLASDEARYVTGLTMTVDAGASAR
ncbi:MAG TPA: SDR family oxidoreductase, partial [Acidimicrobiales bacterium]